MFHRVITHTNPKTTFAIIGLVSLLLIGLWSCQKNSTLFLLLDSKQTGIDFNNDITEYDSLNILNS
ncbi:MAG: hypothetical protein SFU99_04255, partial [Saprospiraceae bacterium]|nr:hypothetical protein [Saprospiraceae bacterium]